MKKPENNPFVHDFELDFDPSKKLSENEAREQAEKLREAIEYHDYRYYSKNNPVISDKAYDRLFERLKQLEDEFDLKDPNSPTRRIGAEPIDKFETVEHVSQMLSISASEEEKDVREWGEKVRSKVDNPEYHCETKFDGISVELVYEEGGFERAVTRGNGVEGDDITENVKTIRSLPLKLHDAPKFLAVRGEIYMPKDGFQELNRKRVEIGKEPFANTRNAAAGTVRQLDPEVVADRPLDIFFYDIMDASVEIENQAEAVKLMNRIGLKVSDRSKIVEDVEDFVDYRERIMEDRENLNYDIDGVIAKVNSFEKRQKLGFTSAHPRWAYAYKFPAKTGTTKVKDITVQVGRTGKLTPVALLEPVDVKGVTVSRASLHNEKQAHKLGIGEGAEVKVERSGDVIPQVKEVISESDKVFEMPSECPVCGSRVIREGEHHFCSGGVSCPSQLMRRLEYFAAEEAMDITGIGEKTAEQLVKEGLVEELPELYQLKKEDLLQLEKFGEKSVDKLLKEIEGSKKVDLASFLTAMGIRHVGKETARDLAESFDLGQLTELSEEEIQDLEGIGPEVAHNLVEFFEGQGGETIEKLLDIGITPIRKETGNKLEGLKMAITGVLEGRTRRELIDLLERNGADVTSSVSGETDYLVVGENPGETKMTEAKKHNVAKLGEEEFRKEMLGKLE
ncbi:MAG: NAD-dependent DNA ligase LigA [Candidatus Nanohaloarchaea archaeon]